MLALPDLAAREFTVVIYNVENLFDAGGVAKFADYQPATPAHPGGYTPRKLFTKLQIITWYLVDKVREL